MKTTKMKLATDIICMILNFIGSIISIVGTFEPMIFGGLSALLFMFVFWVGFFFFLGAVTLDSKNLKEEKKAKKELKDKADNESVKEIADETGN